MSYTTMIKQGDIQASANGTFVEVKVISPDKKTETFKNSIISPWGTDNKFPSQALEFTRKSSVLASGLRDIVAFTYGMGIYTYEIVNGEIKETHDATVDKFFEFSCINRYLKMAIDDFFTLGNAFPWFIFKGGKLHQLRCIKAPRARLERVNPDSGRIEYLWESAQWDHISARTVQRDKDKTEGAFFKKIRLLDPWDYQWQIGQSPFKKEIEKDGGELACTITDYTSDRDYYHDAPWHTAIHNGWLDIDIDVPKMKKNFFKNGTTLTLIISIDEKYWFHQYGEEEWRTMKEDERTKIKTEKYNDINKNLTGSDNAYKSIASGHYVDASGNSHDLIKITAIDNKMKGGEFNPDAQQSAAVILGCVGMDPAISGLTIPSAVTNSRSGSDKREALFILNNKLKIVRDAILEPLYMVKHINGWNQKIHFGFKNIELTTLDKNPTGQETKGTT